MISILQLLTRQIVENDRDRVGFEENGGEHVHLWKASEFICIAFIGGGSCKSARVPYGRPYAYATTRSNSHDTESSHRSFGRTQCHHPEHSSPGHLQQGESKARASVAGDRGRLCEPTNNSL